MCFSPGTRITAYIYKKRRGDSPGDSWNRDGGGNTRGWVTHTHTFTYALDQFIERARDILFASEKLISRTYNRVSISRKYTILISNYTFRDREDESDVVIMITNNHTYSSNHLECEWISEIAPRKISGESTSRVY